MAAHTDAGRDSRSCEITVPCRAKIDDLLQRATKPCFFCPHTRMGFGFRAGAAFSAFSQNLTILVSDPLDNSRFQSIVYRRQATRSALKSKNDTKRHKVPAFARDRSRSTAEGLDAEYIGRENVSQAPPTIASDRWACHTRRILQPVRRLVEACESPPRSMIADCYETLLMNRCCEGEASGN